MDLFKRIIDEASDLNIKALTLGSRGEPTMHPNFSEMIEYINKKGNFLEVKINTNASFLTEKLSHSILKNNVHFLIISADHYEKKMYEKLIFCHLYLHYDHQVAFHKNEYVFLLKNLFYQKHKVQKNQVV